MTKRIQDSKSEQVIAEYLDTYFYPVHFPNYSRLNDKENQLKGIDTIITKNGISKTVDEKSAIHYVNKNLPTFAFELNFKLHTGELVDGWFFDIHKTTELYLLSWISADVTENFGKDDVSNLEIILIERKRLIGALSDYGYTKESVMSIAKSIRENNVGGVSNKVEGIPCYFYLTNHLSENPLNLVIKKSFLSTHAFLHVNIKPHRL
jgi:hypothetical protein